MHPRKITAKNTSVSRTPAGSLSVRYHNLEIFRYDAKTKTATVKATRDEAILTRINQALAAGKFPQRIHARGGPKGEQTHLDVDIPTDEGACVKTIKMEAFPHWAAEGGTATVRFFAEPIRHEVDLKAA